MKPILTAAIGAAVFLFAGVSANAQSAPSSVWIQWEADGQPHARAIVSGSCPEITAGGLPQTMQVRAGVAPGFPDTVCDAVLPSGLTVRLGATKLPSIPQAPKRIAIFGDTGCRLKGDQVQACNDPVAWPFATIAKDIAALHPDLVIHVGDYYYRESPCPTGTNCAGSPHGDNADSWKADYFAPMAPLFAIAPIVNVRGNHEDCVRSPNGWARYLSGQAVVACIPHEAPAFVGFDNLLLGDVDDATEVTETLPDPAVFERDLAVVDAAATPHRETWLLTHRPPLFYLATHEKQQPPAAPHVDAFISGHIHLFGAYSFPGEPPQAIVGTGGDNLDPGLPILKTLGGVTDIRFGYAFFQRSGDGWSIEVHDVDTALHRRCRLAARKLTCGPALTGKS
jgi:hypothetical protein